MPRELWLGNVPTRMTEGMCITHFVDIALPHPYKVLLRTAPNGYSRWGIATWQTVDDATLAMSQEGLKWPDGRYMVVRLAYNGTCDNEFIFCFVVKNNKYLFEECYFLFSTRGLKHNLIDLQTLL